ncbi:hypothetical protein P8C59_001045 [Phyllachora maydis]|uniref:Uncharacterized protein n=1 Tax=Phyllachora maydis TaxID=1825666 RepID=A0AAD9M7D1_9PEZI|nr:hypothetical protein P8C59_001045 [Phyllachora maydis]
MARQATRTNKSRPEMRSTTVLAQCMLAATALAAPQLLKRDLATLQTAITNIASSLGALDKAIKGITADVSSTQPVLEAATAAQKVLSSAATNISASQPLSLSDALSLQTAGKDLTTAVNTTIGDLVAKKPVFDQMGVSSIVLTQLQAQKNASAALTAAIVSKIPAIGQGIANQTISQSTAVIDQAIAAFSAPGSATTGTATPPAGAPASAASTPSTAPAPAPAPAASGAGAPASAATAVVQAVAAALAAVVQAVAAAAADLALFLVGWAVVVVLAGWETS